MNAEFARHDPRLADVLRYAHRADPATTANYEALFEWVLTSHQNPAAPSEIRDAFGILVRFAPTCVARVLGGWPEGDGTYLRHLARFGNEQPTRVFTLNYDTLVEDACERASIRMTTGFDHAGSWDPRLFESRDLDLALSKLHGSLSWHEVLDRGTGHARIVEVRDKAQRPSRPVLKLGPIKTERRDEPRDEVYDALRQHFESTVDAAHTCVVIGYGFTRSDQYLTDLLIEAVRQGMRLVEVNPAPCAPPPIQRSSQYRSLPLGARASLFPGGPLARLLASL